MAAKGLTATEKTMKNTLIVLAIVSLVAGAVAQTGRAEFEARMTGQGKGKAKWKTRDQGTQLQGELEVEGENLPRNTTYSVKVGAYSFTVRTDGFGRYNLARRYTTATRPNITTGTIVRLMRTDATVAQSGTFARVR